MVRHILGLSGGKDSTALAVLLHKEIPDLEYIFCDTEKELPETYEYLDRIESVLGIKIERIGVERDFDFWLAVYGGLLPNHRGRWCTKMLKIKPIEKYLGADNALMYVGLRADEQTREGYLMPDKGKIQPVYPFKDRGLVKADIINILNDCGLGLPSYYEWRSRSGCFFCFFQRKYEWAMLAVNHPALFAEAQMYERDGFHWRKGEPLETIYNFRHQIIAEHQNEEESDELPCLICQL